MITSSVIYKNHFIPDTLTNFGSGNIDKKKLVYQLNYSYLKYMKNQGKRPEQIKFSEDATFWALVGLVLTLLYTLIR